MTLPQLIVEGAFAAGELLALLIVPPAVAAPITIESRSALEGPVQLHRLSTTVNVRLLGALADVRVAQHLRNAGSTTADLGAHLPAVDEGVDALRVVRGGREVDLLGGECEEAPSAGRVRLSPDEAIADALQLPPGDDAIVEAVAAQPLHRQGGIYRAALPIALDAEAPRASLIEHDGRPFLVIVPHREAALAAVTLRPSSGDARRLELGAVDPRTAVLIPLRDRIEADEVAEGAVEIELTAGGGSHWSSVVAERREAASAAQVRVAE